MISRIIKYLLDDCQKSIHSNVNYELLPDPAAEPFVPMAICPGDTSGVWL